VLAANVSGPRRIKAGAARDHILGVHAISGRGEAFKSGGRVVKNVTGYDLSKAMAGSWGTLAVVTDLTFKVLPAAETETTLVLRSLTDEQAANVMAHAMGSSAEVSGAAHLPVLVSGKVAGGAFSGAAATVLRMEGVAPSVAWRIGHLKDLLKAAGEMNEIGEEPSRTLWREIRDCAPFAGGKKPVWRVSMAPSEGHRMIDALRRQAGVNAFYDWQGGLIWLEMAAEPEAAALRAMIRRFGGGHATLIRAGESERASLDVFEPQPSALAALSARLKAEFDPKGILNPGRMSSARPI
jgi:glycolate oxidase FAD binding subunit